MADITVPSPITGTVWKINVRLGDSVGPEDTLIIFESMKMEIPLQASEAGQVKAILVAEGDVVEEGMTVVVMEIAT
jgi:acetyl-CoA carboxylase biotin carboxyl carrier protein